MKNADELDEFARLVVEQIRDKAIRELDNVLNGNHVIANRWRQAMSESPEKTVETLIPDCVDEAIFRLLHAIDEGAITLRYSSSSGGQVDLGRDGEGELAGWYLGSDGWRNTYSNERYIDDFADLTLDDLD